MSRIDKTDLIIDVCGVGLGRKNFLLQEINKNEKLKKLFYKNFNIITTIPTLKTMCSPLGVIYGDWEDNLLNEKIDKEDIGKSIFQLIKERRKIKLQN